MVDICNDRIQGGTGVGLATANERIMRDNEFHHSREKMFVVASSYTVPKGSALAVCSIHVLVRCRVFLILVYFTANTANADELAAGHGGPDEAGERREQPSAARPPPHDQGLN